MAVEYIDEKKSASADSVVDDPLSPDSKELESYLHDAPLVDLKTVALTEQVGEVYDDVRAVDLGVDGKERPIGESVVVSHAQVYY